MPNWVTRSLKFIRNLPGRSSPKWPWPLRKIRKATISDSERDYFERYGETVIARMASTGFSGEVLHARDWLTERADSRERREQWISTRDLILEIVVIGLIGWEIRMSYRQERLQSQDFQKQQQVLTNLQSSSAATASTLTALQRTAELTNTTLQAQLDAVRKSEAQAERSAKAGETSASTASQALHISERAYVHMTASLAKPPSAGEKLQYSVLLGNSGRTPALELTASMAGVSTTSSTSVNEAHAVALNSVGALPTPGSVGTLAAGQTAAVPADALVALTESEVDQITEGKILVYIFATVSYKDVFQQPHHTEICGFYDPPSKTFSACHEHNKFD